VRAKSAGENQHPIRLADVDDAADPPSLLGLPVVEFAFPGPLRDRLVSAILEGRKVSTTALALDYEIGRELLPQPGQRAVVIDSRDRPVAVIEFTSVRSTLLGEVDLAHAVDEGEGHATVETWRAAHEAYWHSEQVRAELGNPSFTVNDTTPVVLERFKVIERL
jgi:uncharacterized protein YhfF